MACATLLSRLRPSSSPTEARGRLCAELSPWAQRRAGVGFGVTIERLTTSTLEFTHSGRLSEGTDYLLEVPRPRRESFKAICRVKSCGRVDRAQFDTPLADDDYRELLQRMTNRQAERVTSARTRMLFILFGFVGTVTAVFLI